MVVCNFRLERILPVSLQNCSSSVVCASSVSELLRVLATNADFESPPPQAPVIFVMGQIRKAGPRSPKENSLKTHCRKEH